MTIKAVIARLLLIVWWLLPLRLLRWCYRNDKHFGVE